MWRVRLAHGDQMSANTDTADIIAAKVAAILATSAHEPGIHEMNHLMKMTETARQYEQAYAGMEIPTFTTQTSHLHG